MAKPAAVPRTTAAACLEIEFTLRHATRAAAPGPDNRAGERA